MLNSGPVRSLLRAHTLGNLSLLATFFVVAIASCSSSKTEAPPAASAGAPSAGASHAGRGGEDASLGGEANAGESAGGEANAGESAGGEANGGQAAGDEGGAAGATAALPDYLLKGLEAAAKGGKADLNGDGSTDLETTVELDRTVTRVFVRGKVILVVTRFDDGHTDKSGDFNLDGKADYTELELTNSAAFTRSTEADTDYDGTFDLKETFEIVRGTGSTHSLRQVLSGATWVTASERTNQSGSVLAGSGECSFEYPAEKGSKNIEEVELTEHLRIVQCTKETSAGSCVLTATKGACTRAQVASITEALTVLFRNEANELEPLRAEGFADSAVINCLKERQPPFLEGLIHNLATGQGIGTGVFNGTRIGCGVTCPDSATATVLGSTDGDAREELNLNMAQDPSKLLDTLLHELIHSSGYDGSTDHNDVNGAQDDPIYACSAWCTGRSLKSAGPDGPTYDPKGSLDRTDCIKCSGTAGSKKECCAENETACSDGCCPHACAADGHCQLEDPCDPSQNGGNFDKCRLTGNGRISEGDQGCTANVTWTVEKVDALNLTVLLVPKGTTICTTALEDDCDVDPVQHQIVAADGHLELNYKTGTRRYRGEGHNIWPVSVSCPDTGSGTTAYGSAWFSQSPYAVFPSGGPIAGEVETEGGTVEWSWAFF